MSRDILNVTLFISGLFLLPLVWVVGCVLVDYMKYTWYQRLLQKELAEEQEALRIELADLYSRRVVYHRDERFVARYMAAQRLLRKNKV